MMSMTAKRAGLRNQIKFHRDRAALHAALAQQRRDYHLSGNSQDRLANDHLRKAREAGERLLATYGKPVATK